MTELSGRRWGGVCTGAQRPRVAATPKIAAATMAWALAAIVGCETSTQPGAAPKAPEAALGQAQAAMGTANGLPDRISYALNLGERRLIVSLEHSVPAKALNYHSYDLTADGALVERSTLANPGCNYRGRAQFEGEAAGGFIAVNLCQSSTHLPDGVALRGVVAIEGQLWDIEPRAGAANSAEGVEHRLSASQRGGRNSGATVHNEPARTQVGVVARLPLSAYDVLPFREGTPQETKYIELLLVNDAARVAQRGTQTESDGLALIEATNALLDGSDLSPRIRLVLAGQIHFQNDPYPLYSRREDTHGNPIELLPGEEVDHAQLLDSFLHWAVTSPLPDHDEHMLLSGQNFLDSSAGLAPVGAACLVGQNGFLVQADSATAGSTTGFSILSTAHELGHTLGMGHDPDTASCPNFEHIMSAIGCSNCPLGGIDFSPCSQQDFAQYLASANYLVAACADDLPSSPSLASCGDGVVSLGESCDCGSGDCSGIDPCCNGQTCQLSAGAVCSDYNDGCCSGCQIIAASQSFICRAAQSDCDSAEQCTGLSAQCPDDTFETAGTACLDEANNEGVCYLGLCMSRTPQCQQLGVLLAQQDPDFDPNLAGPTNACPLECETAMCMGAPGSGINCLQIGGTEVPDGVSCTDGQCVGGRCVTLVDECPENDAKTAPGRCGCATLDIDIDRDGTLDCFDGCPMDTDKASPGQCGCGQADLDSDSDGTADCNDECPDDSAKTAPGACGCSRSDLDDDADGTPNCLDECPDDVALTRAGLCGCGIAETDDDRDGVVDCLDECPLDPETSVQPCAELTLAASEVSSASEPLDEGVALRVETTTSGLCSVSTPPRSGPATPARRHWWALAGAVAVLRRRRRGQRSKR